ncbi:hypothetical protein [Pseudodesulfovibrio piezophilus]|uniref:Uncharacterized protein n=1 Tax=Pseudodesulfovibrio piezophilus (strain DSM 21447 / JCM 15486 / C1TLV30) TaxID=1322246 RepID=M1WKH2_PSEP2|nr:hypothetical protein [Pseudodesulfovibrio piezophilus]CCH49596.1 conserved exported protein of unknown function [Pseudodesulfovibrio piezophilus C1TLV30]
MKHLFVRNTFFAVAILVLPGCMILNATLGVVGLVSTGPLQYAGTAYTVGEYTYEFAVNDKSPQTVFQDKMNWLLGPTPASPPENKKIRKSPPLSPEAPLHKPPAVISSSNSLLFTPPSLALPVSLRNEPTNHTQIISTHNTDSKMMTKDERSVLQKVPESVIQKPRDTPPSHRTFMRRPLNPLFEKINKLEHCLALAERVVRLEPEHGVRLSVNAPNEKHPRSGVNGSGVVRYHLE